MRKVSKKGVLRVCVIIGFFLTLYMVEAGSFGSAEVALHNGGYGTFDMKKYDAEVVAEVLAYADSEYVNVSYKYYFADSLFIIFFGLFQCMLSAAVYGKNKVICKRFAIAVPIARGFFDLVENILLLKTIHDYPKINNGLIATASVSTQCKLWCIRIWAVTLILGIGYHICKRIYATFTRH